MPWKVNAAIYHYSADTDQAIREVERSKDARAQREEELNLYRSMRSLVQIATERGAFDLFRYGCLFKDNSNLPLME